jgi:hypothetical protein
LLLRTELRGEICAPLKQRNSPRCLLLDTVSAARNRAVWPSGYRREAAAAPHHFGGKHVYLIEFPYERLWRCAPFDQRCSPRCLLYAAWRSNGAIWRSGCRREAAAAPHHFGGKHVYLIEFSHERLWVGVAVRTVRPAKLPTVWPLRHRLRCP